MHKRNVRRSGLDLERFDWDQLRTLLACARAGNLGEAANRLGSDPSTVSRRLTRLEDTLGVSLFDRGRHGIVMTAAGEQVVPATEELARSIQRLAAAVGAVEAVAEGVVRISAPPGVSDSFLAPLAVELHRRHPKIQLDIDARVSVVDLTRGEADLALRTIRPRSGDLVMTRLAKVRSLPVAAPAYARELGTLKRVDDARWIFWGHELAHLAEQEWLATHVKAPPVLRTSHYATQIAATHAGLGLMLVPEPYLEVHGLVAVPPGRALAAAWNKLPVGELWLVGHRALRDVPRVAAVWELLVERMTIR